MSVIEDRILSMKFDNKQFEAGVKITMGTLKLLQNSLNFSGGSKGIDDAQAAVSRFSMGGMSSAIEGVSGKFLALSTVAITALTNITNKAVDAGMAMGKSLTIQPIMDGFNEYELKMGSIQTILANTSRHGTGLKDVTASLDELNKYADKTIYNFGDMTKNIGLFTNAGIDVGPATSMIKGFSNAAAASGTSSQGAAGAAYQLSQAMSAGTIRLMDWRSLTNVGMGNKNMQNSIIEIADAMGTLDEAGISATDVQSDFNGSLEKNWLSADVMSKYLEIMAGDMDDASMAALGLSEAQIKSFREQQVTAEEAATKVRTWTQLIGTLQEAVGSSWAETFDILLGDFDQATELFTNIEQTLSPMIGAFGDARNELLKGWADGGGRADIIEGLSNAFQGLMSIIKPIGQAFRDIFPPMTVDTILRMSSAFKEFTQSLIVGEGTAGKIRRTFAGVFAIFGIGWEVVKGLFSGFMQLFGGVQSGAGGFLSLTAVIGDWLVAAHKAISEGEGLSSIFGGLGTILTIPIKLFSALGEAIAGILGALGNLGQTASVVWGILARGDFKGGIWEEDSPAVNTLFKIREALVTAGSALEQFWNIMAKGDFVSGVFSEDSPIVDGMFKLREMLSGFFDPGNLSTLLGAGAAGGLALAIRKVLKDGINLGFGDTEGLFDKMKGMFDGITGTFESVTGVFDGLTGALTTMQNNIKANIILKIAIAVGVLAASMKVLSTLDAGQIATSMGAIVTGLGTLLGAMAILARVAGSAGFLAIPSLATAMVSLSIAVLILATSVKVLSSLSWEELAKGLLGLAAVLGMVVAAAVGLSKVQGSILRTGLAMIPLAIGIRILAGAVKSLAELEWSEIGRGLTALAGTMFILAGALRLMPPNMASTGAGLLMVGAGIGIIAGALKLLGSMDAGSLAKGLLGLAGSLVIIGVALKLFPGDIVRMGAGLILVAAGISVISGAVMAMGGMSWEELAIGLTGLAGSLAILAVALLVMNGTLAGSAALVLAAAAIAMLVPPMILMGALSWGDILKGLVGLAGALTVIGVAGLLLTPVVPTLLALGAALVLFGIALGAAGLGAQAFVTALSMFVSLIDKSKASLIGLMDLIPLMAAKLAEGIIAFATTISANAATFVGAFKDLILALLDAIIEIAPRIGEALTVLLQTFLQIIIDNTPGIAQAFTVVILTFLQTLSTNVPLIVAAIMDMMIRILNAIAARMPDLVTAGVNVIVSFIQGVTNNLPRITDAGANLIITFVNSLANTISQRSGEMRTAGLNLAIAIVDGMTGGLISKVGSVASAAADLGRKAIAAAKNAIDSNSPSKEFIKIGQFAGDGFVVGMDESQGVVSKAAAGMGEAALYGTREGLTGVERIFADVASAGNQVWNLLARRDFVGGFWDEDAPVAKGLLHIRDQFTTVGRAADETVGILTTGNFRGKLWDEDSPIVKGLFGIRRHLVGVSQTAEAAWGALTRSDVPVGAIFGKESPITKSILQMHEAVGPNLVENFQQAGDNIVQGFVNGVQNGQNAFHKVIADMSNGALQTARDVLGINSPSREFEKIGEYSADGVVKGTSNKTPEVKKAGANLATNLMTGFTTGVGKTMPKAIDSIFKTLESGTADVKFWGPNSPATMQLLGMHDALKAVNFQMAEFYGEVNRADPESMAAYADKAGDNLYHLTELFAGLKDAANKAFAMMAEGKGLDAVLSDGDILSGIVNSLLTLVPGGAGVGIGIGISILDGLMATLLGPDMSLYSIVGDFLGGAVRWIGGLFGIDFPSAEEEVKKGEEAVEDFLVTVEDGHGRFQKLTEEGIAALTDTLSNVDDLLKMDNNPKITPVLDLTQFNKDHTKMLSTLEPPVDISMNTSNAQASGVFAMQQELKNAQSDVEPVTPVTNIELKQYNSSPKALSNVEIYRQTKSQLSLAREALKV